MEGQAQQIFQDLHSTFNVRQTQFTQPISKISQK